MSNFHPGKMQAVSSFAQCAASPSTATSVLSVLVLSIYRRLWFSKPGRSLRHFSWLCVACLVGQQNSLWMSSSPGEGDIKSETFQEKPKGYRCKLCNKCFLLLSKRQPAFLPAQQPDGVPKHNQLRLNTGLPTRLKLDSGAFIKGEFNCGAQSGCKIL